MSQPADYDWSLVDLNDQPVSVFEVQGQDRVPEFLGDLVRALCAARCRRSPSWPGTRGSRARTSSLSAFRPTSSTEAVRRFVAGKDLAHDDPARRARFPSVFYTEGIPATFLIAADGRIAASEVGAADWNEPHVVEFLEKLAAPASPDRDGAAELAADRRRSLRLFLPDRIVGLAPPPDVASCPVRAR